MNDPAKAGMGAAQYRIAPVADQHFEQSSRMIQAAASRVSGQRSVVLGAGRCSEIGLVALASRFEQIFLVDLDRAALDEGLAATALSDEQTKKIDIRIADLTGLTDELQRQWRSAIADASDPQDAIEQMAAVADAAIAGSGSPEISAMAGERFDLVVASCLLSQLHAPAARRAEQLFAERYAGDAALLRSAERWLTSLQALARRIEADFMARLPALVSPGGRIYLSETVQTCLTELAPDGAWSTAGTYRMTKTLDLTDYIDQRFAIEDRGRWTWVASVPQAGQPGKLFDVQAMILKVNAGVEKGNG